MSMIIDALPLLFDLLHRMAVKRGKRRSTSYFEWTERLFPGQTKDLLSFHSGVINGKELICCNLIEILKV